MTYVSSYGARPVPGPAFGLGNIGTIGAIGLGALGLGAMGGGALGTIGRIALPIGGGYLGYTTGADWLRRTSIGQTAVGWLSQSPVGRFLGADPYRPVGGALGALAGWALGGALF